MTTSFAAAIEGRCHCGNLAYRFATPQEPMQLPLRACQCRFCRMHGAVTARDPAGLVEFYARDPGLAIFYRFASKTTDFMICARCGAYVGAVIAVGEQRFATLNMRLSGVDLAEVQPVVYDDESPGHRARRRAQLFTPVRRWPFRST